MISGHIFSHYQALQICLCLAKQSEKLIFNTTPATCLIYYNIQPRVSCIRVKNVSAARRDDATLLLKSLNARGGTHPGKNASRHSDINLRL